MLQSALNRLLPTEVPSVVQAGLRRILGLDRLETTYRQLREQAGQEPIPDRLIRHLQVTCRASPADLRRVPRQGAVVAVVNHPYGILEGAVLASLLRPIREDVKFLANSLLAGIPEIRDLVIPVDPFGGPQATRANRAGVRQALQHLRQGGMLVVFPAGEVAHFRWKDWEIADPEWNSGVARLIRASGAGVAPMWIGGANSLLFQALGLLHPRLRTAMLARELLNKRGAQVEVRIGSPVAAEKLLTLPDDEARTQYLRWRTHLLANRQDFKARTSRPLRRGKALEKAPVAAAVPAELLAADVASLNPLTRSGDLAAYLATAAELPHVLPEIGRLREITFRAAGEGAGKPLDLDRFDEHYLHLFVWNERKREIAGAYRLGQVDVVPELYTATLFKYDAALLDRLGPALELGRSFVRAEYQKSFSPLLLLWLGIGKFLARHPRYKVLFGPVSISNQYPTISRQLMVSFLERHATLDCWKDLVAARNPFRGPRAAHSGLDLEDLGDVVTDVDPARPGVPVLLRQYLKLGGKLLGFNLDPDFSDALDGLIVVDLTQTEPKWLDRYLGKEWRMSQACAESTDPQT